MGGIVFLGFFFENLVVFSVRHPRMRSTSTIYFFCVLLFPLFPSYMERKLKDTHTAPKIVTLIGK